jgi:hypothetical protein
VILKDYDNDIESDMGVDIVSIVDKNTHTHPQDTNAILMVIKTIVKFTIIYSNESVYIKYNLLYYEVLLFIYSKQQ